MRLAPALLAAALTAVAAAHEFPGEKHHEHEGHVHKGFPVGQFNGDHKPHGFQEASWWEKLKGNHKHHEHGQHKPGQHEHGMSEHRHFARDAEAEAKIPKINNEHIEKYHYHHKHAGHHKHDKNRHHKEALNPETGVPTKPWNKWGWFSGVDINPREAREPIETVDGTFAGTPEQHRGDLKHKHHKGKNKPGHKVHSGHKHKPGHHENHGHEQGNAAAHFGEHGRNGHAWSADSGHHKFPILPKFDKRDEDSEEFDPENEFFDATDFEDDEEEVPNLMARAEDAEEDADPNEVSVDQDYYDFGDDGDNDILDGELKDTQDVDDDEDMGRLF